MHKVPVLGSFVGTLIVAATLAACGDDAAPTPAATSVNPAAENTSIGSTGEPGMETSLPAVTVPTMTPAPNANAGGGGAAPTATDPGAPAGSTP